MRDRKSCRLTQMWVKKVLLLKIISLHGTCTSLSPFNRTSNCPLHSPSRQTPYHYKRKSMLVPKLLPKCRQLGSNQNFCSFLCSGDSDLPLFVEYFHFQILFVYSYSTCLLFLQDDYKNIKNTSH